MTSDFGIQVSELICDSSESGSVPIKRVPFRGWGDFWKPYAGTVDRTTTLGYYRINSIAPYSVHAIGRALTRTDLHDLL